MIRQFLVCGAVAMALVSSAQADDKHNHTMPKAPTNPAFEKMKSLVGTWVKVGDDGKASDEVFSVIKLTAAGSAVHETIMPGTSMEMISVYTPDGEGVALTHYCMLGNQPRMKAAGSADAKQLKFDFVGGGNLDPAKDMHMHGATLTFVDADHIQIEGVAWDKGAPAKDMCGTTKLERKK